MKKRVSRLVQIFCVVLLVAAMLLPAGSAKYIRNGPTRRIAVTWLDWPYVLWGVNCNTDTNGNNGNWYRRSKLEVKEPSNTDSGNVGWYAIILYGADGGNYLTAPAVGGQGGVVKGLVYLDPGTYWLVAGALGARGSSSYQCKPGAGNSGGNGSAGGGYSALFKSNSATDIADAIGKMPTNHAPTSAELTTLLPNGRLITTSYVPPMNIITNCDAFDRADAATDNKIIAIAGGGGGAGGYADNRPHSGGGHGGGYRNTGLTALGVTSGDSARAYDKFSVFANGGEQGLPTYERGAGGMAWHNYRTYGSVDANGAWHGGGNAATPVGAAGIFLQGGSGNSSAWGGGGGGGFYGGGSGGKTGGSTDDGGGGGGASYICRSNAGKPSYTFWGSTGFSATAGNLAVNGNRTLDPSIVSYLNSVALTVSRNAIETNRFAGMVVLQYLGPNDPGDTNVIKLFNGPTAW